MTIKYVTIGAIIAILLTPTTYVSASASKDLNEEEKESGFYNEDGGVKYTKDRPAINPDFDPDEDCNLAYELKCLPGSQQECPEGYDNGEDNSCSPAECQEGYHGVDDDETGLCYPNSEDCDGYVVKDGVRYPYVFVEGENGEGDRCANPAYLCDDESSHEICKEYLDLNAAPEEEIWFTNQVQRPAINPDFAPDRSCLFDVFQLKCIPGAEQECPKPEFSAGDPEMCFPNTFINEKWEWECPDGYHWTEDDETGQCYPNDEGCEYNTLIFNEDKTGCVEHKIECDLNEDHPLCNGVERTDGIKVCDQPDHPGYKSCTDEDN